MEDGLKGNPVGSCEVKMAGPRQLHSKQRRQASVAM